MSTSMEAPASTGTILTSVHVPTGVLSFRDAVPADVEAYVTYWHYSGEEVKDLLGIDRERLGTPDDSRERFMKMIRTPGVHQPNVIFSITLNGEVIGYTNINQYSPDENYTHLHTYRSNVRSALRVTRLIDHARTSVGLAAALIGPGLAMYFDLFPVRRLTLQTRTTNRWINRALDMYMPPSETTYVANPPGLAAPGECHRRFVRREDVPWMLSRAKVLREGQVGRIPAEVDVPFPAHIPTAR